VTLLALDVRETTPVTSMQEVAWSPEKVWTGVSKKKILYPAAGFKPRTIQSVENRYTDFAIPVPADEITDNK
jgi:hypothetical protein